ncbi:MAG: peptidase in kexin sedolisin, partial [Clostridiales bacterium]|nr:peptidase in kexin sedolisin [Clostridiales bacterium]
MKRMRRVISCLLVIAIIFTNFFGGVVSIKGYAASPEKKEKFIIKHADNEKLREKFFDENLVVENEPLVSDVATGNMVEAVNTEEVSAVDSSILYQTITEEIIAVEAMPTDLQALLEGIENYSIEYDQIVSVSGDVYPTNLQTIGEDRIDDPDFNGAGVKIAILDTGIDVDNTELNITGGISFIEGKSYDDDNGHGTALAGIIGARKNGEGIVGIAPDAELYAVKVLDSTGSGYYSDVIKGLEWCIENRIDIVLMSFGADAYSGILHETIQKAYLQDILLVGAAGNSDSNVEYPAAYSEVMAVGAVDESNSIIYKYTNADLVELYAIGNNIETLGLDNNQVITNGSSFSAAHVAGVAAEVWGNDLVKTNDMIRDQISLSGALDGEDSYKVLNAYQAYQDQMNEIGTNPEDNLGDIDGDDTTDEEISVLGELVLKNTIGNNEDVIATVRFSNDHDSVKALIKKGSMEISTETRSDVKGGYDTSTGKYTGTEYTFNFGRMLTGGEYTVYFETYNKGQEGKSPYDFSKSFTVVQPDLIITNIRTNIGNMITGVVNSDKWRDKEFKVTLTVKNIGECGFSGKIGGNAILTNIDSTKTNITGIINSGVSVNIDIEDTEEIVCTWTPTNAIVGEYSLSASVARVSGNSESNIDNNTKYYSSDTIRITNGIMKRKPFVSKEVADPIDVATGNYTINVADISINGRAPIKLERSYNALDYMKTSLGRQWRHSYDIYYDEYSDYIRLFFGDGHIEFFHKDVAGELIFDETKYNNVCLNSDGKLVLDFKGDMTYIFANNKIAEINDGINTTIFTYDTDQLIRVESISGYISFVYDGEYLDYIIDSDGRKVDYNYTNGFLTGITNVDGYRWTYEYDNSGLIEKAVDPNGKIELVNQYDSESRVNRQINEDGTSISFVYSDGATIFTDRDGTVSTYYKDDMGRLNYRIYADGEEKYVYDEDDNVIEFIDKNGNRYTYYYNANGDLESEENPFGVTYYTYTESGKIASKTNPNGGVSSYSYNERNQVISSTDELGRRTEVSYDDSGDMNEMTLPDGSKVFMTYDTKGNMDTITDADGNRTSYTYDNLNRIKTFTNPNGNITSN